VDELIQIAGKKKEPFRETYAFKTFEKVLKTIAPLTLTDPDSENFRPESCRTFHDITRFAHEMAMREMFNVGTDGGLEGAETVRLIAGIPIDVHVININGGLKEGLKKATAEDVLSIPFSALLRGMKSMKWPGPPPPDAKGFRGAHAKAASVTEEQLRETSTKSFAVVSKHYVNFSIRLGYHFSLIEAYAGENIHDNYIKLFFKGGGAAPDRRLRRVRLIQEILKAIGFGLTVKEDVMHAQLTKYKQPDIEEKLVVLGKLTAYTKQLDMVMFNDAVMNMYIDQFMKDHVKPQ
jgi:pyruvate,water dikinase